MKMYIEIDYDSLSVPQVLLLSGFGKTTIEHLSQKENYYIQCMREKYDPNQEVEIFKPKTEFDQ